MKIARRARVPAERATRPNEKWSMDFVAARLIDGRWFRVLTVVDQFTRECVLLLADSSLTGLQLLAQHPLAAHRVEGFRPKGEAGAAIAARL